jgi:transposase-like protein
MPKKAVQLDRWDVTFRYNRGASMQALARELGVSQGYLRRHLLGWGVHVRNKSEAGAMRRRRP